MTNDPVDAALAAFIDHLDGGGPEPILDDLSSADRAEAQRLFDVLRAGRGIDPSLSRPSLAALLADTEFEDLLSPDADTGHHTQVGFVEGLSIDAIVGEVLAALGPGTTPVADVEALASGLSSDAVLVVRGHRLRLQFRPEPVSPDELTLLDPAQTAGPIFGRFPETAGVIVVLGDDEHSSVAIGPHDVDTYLGSPDGKRHEPRITRPPISLGDTIRLYLSEIAPDLSSDFDDLDVEAVDLTAVVQQAATAACSEIATVGKRAKTPAKRDIWGNFGDSEAALVVRNVIDVGEGHLSPDELEARLEEEATKAA